MQARSTQGLRALTVQGAALALCSGGRSCSGAAEGRIGCDLRGKGVEPLGCQHACEQCVNVRSVGGEEENLLEAEGGLGEAAAGGGGRVVASGQLEVSQL